MKDNVIKFLKSKDYVFLDELGKGACGRTVKLKDEVIDEVFVCKKYEPFDDALKDCLLYTSPSPRDRTRSRMPSSA